MSKEPNKQPLFVPPYPKNADIAITGKCNLTCHYCFYANEMTALEDLTTAQWDQAFAKLQEARVMSACLSGGEVFTRPDIFEIIDSLISHKMRYTLLTNATLITDKTIQEFDKGKRRLRLSHIQTSIDGSRAEIHNLSRPNSFDRTIRGLKMLQEAGIPLIVRITLSKHNLPDLENLARFLLEDLNLPRFASNETTPVGSGCRNRDEVALNAHERKLAMEIFDKLEKRYPGRITSAAGPDAHRKSFPDMERSKELGKATVPHRMGKLNACGCIFSKVDILHNGELVPCNLMPNVKIGHILKDDLLTIWRTHPILQKMRLRRQEPTQSIEPCSACQWADYCNAGCPGVAHQLQGTLDAPNPQDCYRLFLQELQT